MKRDERIEEFLQGVWGLQPKKGIAFTPHKDGQDWCELLHDDRDYPYPDNLYFAPNLFRKGRRVRENALPSVWLYADLDEVDPRELDLRPTTAWCTSPNRYQALWLLRSPLRPDKLEDLNRRLTYAIGADKGGWSLTKVLRVPHSISTKYGTEHKVKLLWENEPAYSYREIDQYLQSVPEHETTTAESEVPDISGMSAKEVLREHKHQIPKRILKLLLMKEVPVGERSERLWEIENALIESGLSPVETLVVVRASKWNKFTGRRNELEQLWSEIGRITTEKSREFTMPKWQSFKEFMGTPIPPPDWMVEGIWSEHGHGIIAGEPKTYKSFIATDLAVSVASGKKFLNHFEIPAIGNVLILQEENTPGLMQDRLHKIGSSKGLNPGLLRSEDTQDTELEVKFDHDDLPLYIMNNAGFDLTRDDHMEFLEESVADLKPALVILDPLYLMIGNADENSAQAMSPILKNLLTIKQTHNCGILLIHHYRKAGEGSAKGGGQRIAGSHKFHSWIESALYMERTDDPYVMKVTREFRAAPPQPLMKLDFELGLPGEDYYDVKVTLEKEVDSGQDLRSLLTSNPGITVSELESRMDIKRQAVLRRLERVQAVVVDDPNHSGPGRPSKVVFANREDYRAYKG